MIKLCTRKSYKINLLIHNVFKILWTLWTKFSQNLRIKNYLFLATKHLLHIIFPSKVFLSKLDENNINIPKKNGLKNLSLCSKVIIENKTIKIDINTNKFE